MCGGGGVVSSLVQRDTQQVQRVGMPGIDAKDRAVMFARTIEFPSMMTTERLFESLDHACHKLLPAFSPWLPQPTN